MGLLILQEHKGSREDCTQGHTAGNEHRKVVTSEPRLEALGLQGTEMMQTEQTDREK